RGSHEEQRWPAPLPGRSGGPEAPRQKSRGCRTEGGPCGQAGPPRADAEGAQVTSQHNLLPEEVGPPAPGSGDAISNPMQYIDTDDPVKIEHFLQVNKGAKAYYDLILKHCPKSAERTLAIRKLQEARMWANAAIVFDGRTYPL